MRSDGEQGSAYWDERGGGGGGVKGKCLRKRSDSEQQGMIYGVVSEVIYMGRCHHLIWGWGGWRGGVVG